MLSTQPRMRQTASHRMLQLLSTAGMVGATIIALLVTMFVVLRVAEQTVR